MKLMRIVVVGALSALAMLKHFDGDGNAALLLLLLLLGFLLSVDHVFSCG